MNLKQINSKSLCYLFVLFFLMILTSSDSNACSQDDKIGKQKCTVVSINGMDGSGKTTQVDLLRKTAKDLDPYFPESLAKYYKQPAEFEWWFKKSSPEEFCDNIYGAISLRNGDINNSGASVAVLDKGIDTIDARVTANFLCRGMKEDEISNIIQEFKSKYSIKSDEESIKIFLVSKNFTDRVKQRNTDSDSQDIEKNKYYLNYQNTLSDILKKQVEEKKYIAIDGDRSIDDVNQDILRLIKDKGNDK